jgi:hypothetical protein
LQEELDELGYPETAMSHSDMAEALIRCALILKDSGTEHPTVELFSLSSLGLPRIRPAYLFLCHIPLDIAYECLSSKLEHQPQKPPSPLSLRQLLLECKETITGAVTVKQQFLHFSKPALIGASYADKEKHFQVTPTYFIPSSVIYYWMYTYFCRTLKDSMLLRKRL